MPQPILAHESGDRLLSYRDDDRPYFAPAGTTDRAYAGSADLIACLLEAPTYRAWRFWGSPDQHDGLVLTTAAGIHPESVPLDAGAAGWLPMGPADIAEFAAVLTLAGA